MPVRRHDRDRRRTRPQEDWSDGVRRASAIHAAGLSEHAPPRAARPSTWRPAAAAAEQQRQLGRQGHAQQPLPAAGRLQRDRPRGHDHGVRKGRTRTSRSTTRSSPTKRCTTRSSRRRPPGPTTSCSATASGRPSSAPRGSSRTSPRSAARCPSARSSPARSRWRSTRASTTACRGSSTRSTCTRTRRCCARPARRRPT